MIQLKAMTRSQMKALRNAGLDFALVRDSEDREKVMFDMVDWILDNVYAEYKEELDNMANNECMALAMATYNKAFDIDSKLSEFEAKNSETSTAGN